MAKPLTAEERAMLVGHLVYPSRDPETVDWDGESIPDEAQVHALWEATVQALEAERDRLRAALEEITSIAEDALAPDPPAGT